MTNLSFILARRRCAAFVCLLATIALPLGSSSGDPGCSTGGSTCQNGQCGLAGGSSNSTCDCCPQSNGKTGVSCAAYFGDPGLDATCAENFEDITYPDYAGYEKTEDFNCGWSSTACLQDNLDGKFVCPPEHTGSCPRPVL